MGRLRLFAASLWLTLATAVFCAVVPVGLPHTNAHGSAFNPSNSVVALHASSGANRAVLKRIAQRDTALAASSGSDITAPHDHFKIATALVSTSVPQPTTPAALFISQVRIAAYPRGPPVA